VLYTALTGSRPYPQDSLPELAYAVAVSPPPHAADHVPDLPPAYDEVIAAALAKSPEDRVRSAADLAAALRAVAAGREPVLPRRSPPRRRRLVPVASAAVLLAGLCAAVLGWHPWTAHSSARPLRRVVCAQDLELRDNPRGDQTGTLRHGDVVSVLETRRQPAVGLRPHERRPAGVGPGQLDPPGVPVTSGAVPGRASGRAGRGSSRRLRVAAYARPAGR
jgi:hypothetical protein